MVAKKYWENLVHEFVKLGNEEKHTQYLNLFGYEFAIFKNVFSPALSTDTEWFAEKIKLFDDINKFLEIGCGSGIISCLMALNGVKKVVSADINSQAVKNTKYNAKKHALDISVREGSMYSPIKKDEKFDLIFWNHPFVHLDVVLKNKTPLDLAVFDEGYCNLESFFEGASGHLEDGGSTLLGTSNIARIRMIKKLSKKYSLKNKLIAKQTRKIFEGKKVEIELRLYSFNT